MAVELSRQALKFLKSLQPRVARRIVSFIERLPTSGDIRPIKGRKTPPLYRLRVGKYRIIFLIADDVVQIIRIDTRGDVYKNR